MANVFQITLRCNRKWNLLLSLKCTKQIAYCTCATKYVKKKTHHFQANYSHVQNRTFIVQKQHFTPWKGMFRKALHESLFTAASDEHGYKEFSTFSTLFDDHTTENDSDLYSEVYDDQYNKWSKEILAVAGRHAVLIIQPYIKWGSGKKINTTTELQLAESVALIESLHGWKVVDKVTVGLKSFEKKLFFGPGTFATLKQKIRSSKNITAVFISTKMLRGLQQREIQNAFGVPVFDRYTIVIQLFRQHAVSREAKLQVAMAEIPYMWSRLRGEKGGDKRTGTGLQSYELKKDILVNRETKLKQALLKLRNQRELLRAKRTKLDYPVVAVVGYTNAGKTSLIKALTGDEKMQPENRLFATLDVSTHMGKLPCRMNVLYVDTVGFISDIPTNLLESFVATLEDAILSDVILHVQDISHPDMKAQNENVMKTLKSLKISQDVLKNIVVAGNKVDLVKTDIPTECDVGIPVSAVTLSGITELKQKIEKTLLDVTDRVSLVICVPQGGDEASWLYKEATVVEADADPRNTQNLLMRVIITHSQLQKFRHYFVNSKV